MLCLEQSLQLEVFQEAKAGGWVNTFPNGFVFSRFRTRVCNIIGRYSNNRFEPIDATKRACLEMNDHG